ncbi:hypothetical protein [Spirochaeta isovalerica]|uniref:Uncharacterized protein n=1 Tax=Spirochaeta isovalerica TaxID=150 RepID=A0A841RF80_9SPIO|nr:hypothetical protein [Spirochaeta isovalerica]MBB6482041.1 hypothetical protein [Spirochaeta isovalerica]
MDKDSNPDRLEKVEELLKRKKRNGNQICWIKFNPDAEMSYDISDAEEDIKWMLYEIKRLQNENRELKEFAETLRDQMTEELNRNRK